MWAKWPSEPLLATVCANLAVGTVHHLDADLLPNACTSQQARFDQFVEEFNRERPHEAIAMRCPAEVYNPSPRPYAGVPDLAYRFHDRDVLVTVCGRINISGVLAGQKLGITDCRDRIVIAIWPPASRATDRVNASTSTTPGAAASRKTPPVPAAADSTFAATMMMTIRAVSFSAAASSKWFFNCRFGWGASCVRRLRMSVALATSRARAAASNGAAPRSVPG